MFRILLSLASVIILAMLPCQKASMFNSQPQFTIEAKKNRAFDESCLIGEFKIKPENIAQCLEHCLANCSCQSFQVCQKTECQLCSSNKKDNSSLLQEKDGCIYAMYKTIKYAPGTLKTLEDQCSSMGCPMKYNCCSEQPGLCPQKKICKPFDCSEKHWKRFNCECPAGYHGNQCDKESKSCEDYSKECRKPGKYIIQGPGGNFYEVYCHFDSHGAWTLVMSYSFKNQKRHEAFKKPLYEKQIRHNDHPTWNDYRLGKGRMNSIKGHSDHLLFTCDYEKQQKVEESDYLAIPFDDLGSNFDFLNTNHDKSPKISSDRGKVGGMDLAHCPLKLHQNSDKILHADISSGGCLPLVKPNNSDCPSPKHFHYFGSFDSGCVDKTHRCVQNDNSTTQLWFGHKKKNGS